MDKMRRCSRCGEKKLLGNHDRGQYNTKNAGVQICPDCAVALLYEKFLNKE